MTLTPSDIEQKTFSTALRGYNLDEVDDFLDEVVRSMRKLQEELETAHSELETKSAEPDDLAEPVPAAPPVLAAVVEAPPPPPVTPIDESALGKALIAAQETAERIVNDARSEADEILVRAKNEAETFEESRLLRKEEAEQEITRIDGLVNRVKAELADLSVAVGAELEEMSGVVDTVITDLDGSLGEPAGSEDDLAADDDLADDHDGQNIVGVGAEPLERDIDGADEPSSGRRRHRSESGAIEAEDDSGNADSEEDDSGNAD
ncbi:MAG: DivIVA domain-containing protein, partial [Acidimicrobiia bacterium]